LSTKSGAIIIPSCGYDSLTSDFSAYLSVKTLKDRLGPETETKSSVTHHTAQGGVSGGTISTAMSFFEDIPSKIRRESSIDYYNSPIVGLPVTGFKFAYSIPAPGLSNEVGGFFPMAPVNQSLVQRTWGLKQMAASNSKEGKELAYGPEFTYHEFAKCRTVITSVLWSFTLAVFGVSMAAFSPVSLFVRLFGSFFEKEREKAQAQCGYFRFDGFYVRFYRALVKGLQKSEGVIGPLYSGNLIPFPNRTMQNGCLKMVNVTSTSGLNPEVWAKTTITGKGDPGYLLTSSE
jgi:hypothetical protein